MAEKKATTKAAPVKKAATKKAAAPKKTTAMSVAEIAKAAKISTEEVYLGIGWLFKEGKVKDENNQITLA